MFWYVFRELFVDGDGNFKKENDTIVNLKLAGTLRILQYDDIAGCALTKIFMQDINKQNGGHITEDDINSYQVLEKEAIATPLNIHGKNYTLHTTPLPGGGPVLTHILNMIEG